MPNTNPSQVAWHGAGHPAESHPCPTCNANHGAPCVSVVPAFGHGATGTPIRGLHAARVDASIDHHSMCDHTECAVFGCVKGAA